MNIVKKKPELKVVLDKNICISATLIIPNQTLSMTKKDEDDNRILECAVEGKVQYIVSGDKQHLLPLKEYQGVKILSAAEFLIELDL